MKFHKAQGIFCVSFPKRDTTVVLIVNTKNATRTSNYRTRIDPLSALSGTCRSWLPTGTTETWRTLSQPGSHRFRHM
jgi:hypothetical protein